MLINLRATYVISTVYIHILLLVWRLYCRPLFNNVFAGCKLGSRQVEDTILGSDAVWFFMRLPTFRNKVGIEDHTVSQPRRSHLHLHCRENAKFQIPQLASFIRRETKRLLSTYNLKDHPLSAVRDCTFSILVSTATPITSPIYGDCNHCLQPED
jgi:hypothetical protein